MATYYVDSFSGSAQNDGLSENSPKSSYRDIDIKPGDTVLFKAGSVFRDSLFSPDGQEDNFITYDMYGIGEKPRFLGSINITDVSLWYETKDKNIWAYKGKVPSEVCNIIFNDGESCGILCWEYKDLNAQGKWYDDCIGYAVKHLPVPESTPEKPREIYMYSEKNPAEYYNSIECAIYGNKFLFSGMKYINIKNLSFRNSGGFVWGTSDAKCITFDSCDCRFIGGLTWDRLQRIRFGNAFEVWNYGEDVTIKNCYIDEVYDSCVTYQGPTGMPPCKRLTYKNNVFKNYGMAAFEFRDVISEDVLFENNICIGAGRGFSLQGETPPRKSELWPQPMGHHLFIWKIYMPSENGKITVKNNVFYDAPYGAAIYSTIAPEAEKQIIFENNIYYKAEEDYLIRFGGKNYGKNEFDVYMKEQQNDFGSMVVDVLKYT